MQMGVVKQVKGWNFNANIKTVNENGKIMTFEFYKTNI